MGKYGSSWLVGYRIKKKLDENFFNDLNEYIVAQSQAITFIPSSDSVDRGVIALADKKLLANSQYLITAGNGTFQEWVEAAFLEHHRYDKEAWSIITVCNNYET